jgi:hypothetical protein
VANILVGEAGATAGVPGLTGVALTVAPALLPTPLVAITVNAYVVPLVSPVMTHGLAEQVADAPPGDAVTVYPVIAVPPLEAGAVHDRLTE